MANSHDWQITHIKCFGKIKKHYTSYNLEAANENWLFVYGETKYDEEGEHTIGTAALVPSKYVNNGSFIGDDISRFEISDTYAIHILANCRLLKSFEL